MFNIYNLSTPRYSWNTAKVDVKHQSINTSPLNSLAFQSLFFTMSVTDEGINRNEWSALIYFYFYPLVHQSLWFKLILLFIITTNGSIPWTYMFPVIVENINQYLWPTFCCNPLELRVVNSYTTHGTTICI
jgi:hypothetical protein